MEIETVGKVQVAVRMENLGDLYEVKKGLRSSQQVRSIDIVDAVVDTGATLVSLPRRLIDQLGLGRVRTRTARTTAGVFSFGICEPVRLTIQDRDCVVEVAEVADDCPVLIGQIPLEALDLVIHPRTQTVVSNPEHGGKWMMDML